MIPVDSWHDIMPFWMMGLGIFVVLGLSIVIQKHQLWILVVTALATIGIGLGGLSQAKESVLLMNGLLLIDPYMVRFTALLLLLSAVVLVLIPYRSFEPNYPPSSVIALMMMSVLGGMVMIAANHLVVFFSGLELLSLPLYVLVGMGHKKDHSSEASFKYFLIGAVSAAFFIFGVALVWASTSTMEIHEIQGIFASTLYQTLPKTFWLGIAMMTVSILFKLGVFPFHFWVPDVYQATPAAINAWMNAATKIAVVGMVVRLFHAFPTSAPTEIARIGNGWSITLMVFAIFSMAWGSLGGLMQKNIKRLLGYSAIIHMGYVLMFLATTLGKSYQETFDVLFFYMVIYAMANVIVFTVVSSMEQKRYVHLRDLNGMMQQTPLATILLGFGLITLAGLPPLGGFFAKFHLFYFVVSQGYSAAVMVAVLTSVISLLYYLHLLSNAFLQKPLPGVAMKEMRLERRAVLAMIAFLILIAGLYPPILMNWLN